MENIRTNEANQDRTIRLDEWIHAWYSAHPDKRMPAEEADSLFVWLCQLLGRNYPTLLSVRDPQEASGQFSSESFVMEKVLPVSFEPVSGCMDYCPADEVVDESTYLFGMGLILYELLTGTTYTNTFGIQVGISFYWSVLQDQAGEENRSSLLSASDIPAEYEEFGEILALLTQFDHDARRKSFPGGSLPAAEYEWDAVDEAGGQVLCTERGSLADPDECREFPAFISENGKQYQVVEGQDLRIRYSFLKKKYRVLYRERMDVSPADWAEGDLGLLADDGEGNRLFVPLLMGDQKGIRRRLKPSLPAGYSSWSEVPYLSLTVVRRKKNCGTVHYVKEQPEVFRVEKRFSLKVASAAGESVSPELELFTDGNGKFKIICDWVSTDGGKLQTSETGD